MKVTEVRCTLGYTYNLGDYTNIRPEITLTADINGEDVSQCLHDLFQTALEHCEEMIDTALEAEGKPAHFSAETRFVAYAAYDEELAIIIPQDMGRQFKTDHPHWNRIQGHHKQGHRFHALWKMLENEYVADGYQIYDDQQINKLPEIKDVFACTIEDKLIMGCGKIRQVLPLYLWKAAGNVENFSRNYENFRNDMKAKAAAQGLTLYDMEYDDWRFDPDVIAIRTAYEERLKEQEHRSEEEEEEDLPFDDDDDEYGEDEDD